MQSLNLHFKIHKAMLSICVVVTISCTPPASNTNQLTANGFSCQQLPKAQVDQILGDFPNNAVKGQMQSALPQIRGIIASMPDEHIQDLKSEINNNNFYMAYQPLGGNLAGLTSFAYRSNGISTTYYCISSVIRDQQSIDFAFLHEIGHCMQVLQDNKFPQEFSDSQRDRVTTIFEDGIRRKSQLQNINPPVREYAFQSKHELFAESYHNYYCSPEANQYLDRTFPLMHQLMSQKFGPTRWESGSYQSQQNSSISSSSISSNSVSSSSIALKLLGNSTVVNGTYTDVLEITVPNNIQQIKLCYGSEQSCLQSQASNAAVTLNSSTTTTKVFRTITPVTVQQDSAVTVLGYDAANSTAVSIFKGVKFDF